MKKGLVMEGGAMRGMFTAGVIDVLMENGIEFDGAIGVSAGAVFGCNYKSKQIGRVIRYNKRFCADPRYCGFKSLLKTGDFYNADFDYNVLPNKLDIWDVETYAANPMDFYVVVTDVLTGNPVYHNCLKGDAEDLQWMRASASMPALSNIVKVGGGNYSDGGTSDSIPLKYFQGIGYDRNVVITTQPAGFRKEPLKYLWIMKPFLRKYPNLIKALETRHIMYNGQMDYLEAEVEKGSTFVICPPVKLTVKPGVKDPEKLEEAYQIGRTEGEKHVEEVKAFLAF